MQGEQRCPDVRLTADFGGRRQPTPFCSGVVNTCTKCSTICLAAAAILASCVLARRLAHFGQLLGGAISQQRGERERAEHINGVLKPEAHGTAIFCRHGRTRLRIGRRRMEGVNQTLEKRHACHRSVEEFCLARVAQHGVSNMHEVEMVIHRRQRSPRPAALVFAGRISPWIIHRPTVEINVVGYGERRDDPAALQWRFFPRFWQRAISCSCGRISCSTDQPAIQRHGEIANPKPDNSRRASPARSPGCSPPCRRAFRPAGLAPRWMVAAAMSFRKAKSAALMIGPSADSAASDFVDREKNPGTAIPAPSAENAFKQRRRETARGYDGIIDRENWMFDTGQRADQNSPNITTRDCGRSGIDP